MNLHVELDGPVGAPPLLLLPGIGTTTAMWEPVVGPLAESFRVLRPDLRGHGRSPAASANEPRARSTTLADLAADVLAVLDDLGIDRTHVVGLSLGGMTALWLATHRPERVARLAVVCTSLEPDRAMFAARAAQVRTGGTGALADAAVARWLTPAFAARDPELVSGLTAAMAAADDESYAQCCEAIAGLDLLPDLGRVAAPTLAVAGAQDLAAPPAHLGHIVDAIAGARLEVVQEAAHCAPLEQPGRVAALLHAHLRAGATFAAGMATRRAVLGDAHVDRTVAATVPLTADFQEFLTRYAWGDVWTRPGLGRRERSMVTLGVLVALGAEAEIAMHVRAAVTNGLTAAEIAEVLQHTALYAGLPRANAAFGIARQVLAASAGDRPVNDP